jgi:hypothetical protein
MASTGSCEETVLRAVFSTGERVGDIAQMSFNSELGIDHITGSINGLRTAPLLRLKLAIECLIQALFIVPSPTCGFKSLLYGSRPLCLK